MDRGQRQTRLLIPAALLLLAGAADQPQLPIREARWLRTPEGGSKCIVFSTHIMQEVERLCDSVVVVARGRTVATGAVAELLAETGESDFEEAFVKLAFGPERAIAHDKNEHRVEPPRGGGAPP